MATATHTIRTSTAPQGIATVYDDAVVLDGEHYAVVVYDDAHARLMPWADGVGMDSAGARTFPAEQGDLLDVEDEGLFCISSERLPGGHPQDMRPALVRVD